VGVSYRINQFWWALTAENLPKSAQSRIGSLLSEKERALFDLFSPSEQRHSYKVYETLMAAGFDQHELLVAGVLHDIGKTREPLNVMERIVVVLVEKFSPHKLASWGRGPARGWKRPFVVKVQHPKWGSEMVKEAGSNDLVVKLVRRHQEPLPQIPNGIEDELLGLLQWADDRS
jgi:putative nucleotidyltransferase with HDIG domain